MKRYPLVPLFLLAALLGGIAFLPQLNGAQAQKKQQQSARTDAVSAAGDDQSGRMDDRLRRQIESLVQEKESRTPAQQKLDSQLVYAIKQRRGQPITDAVPTLEVNVKVDASGRTLVDIRADVTKRVLAAIANAGGKVVNHFKRDRSIRAELPLSSLETIAMLSEVKFIRPADELNLEKVDAPGKQPAGDTVIDLPGRPAASAPVVPAINPTLLRGLRPGFAARAAVVGDRLTAALAAKGVRAAAEEDPPMTDIGAVTAESDTTHRTREARNFFGLNGKGIKIGILSDSFNDNGGYAADILSGDLPGPGNPFGYTTPVTVVQESTTTDEGRAMAQIIHDIVPGAQLFFATANGGQANFANNIRVLRNTHNCDIIVDDVGYFLESPLHKSAIVSKAVDDVVAAGAMYFASAGNAGNLNDGTSGVWEGDFVDAGAATGGIVTVVAGGTWHDFDPSAGVATQNPVNRTTTDARPANLFWSDPLGGSTNDYDLYLISGTNDTGGAGQVVAASTTLQTGTQDPVEQVTVPGSAAGAPGGRRIAIFKKTLAAPRFLHITLNRSRFDSVAGAAIPAFETAGQANGHDATGEGYATAATPADGPFPGVHTSADVVENFSSDGLRRIFYDYNNAPITPGNFSATGGSVKQKPEITAADGVQTTVPGFQPFFGTSAAAPTAAAIAALVKASNNTLTATQVLTALTSTAIDIEAPGTDRDSGVGIIQAYQALQSIPAAPGATLSLGTPTVTVVSGCDTNLDAGEKGSVDVLLTNLGGAGATAVIGTLTSLTPGVTVIQSTSGYPDIAPGGVSSVNSRSFTFRINPGAVACGGIIKFSLTVTFAGGQASPSVFPFTAQTAGTPGSLTNVAYAGAPVTITDNNAAGVNIPLTVSGFTGSVADLNFRFGGSACNAADAATTNGVNHVFVGDLVFKLTSPSGTTVTIISQAGGANNSGNHFCNTVLDDDTPNGSIQAVAAGTNLNTGTFKPASLLSAFDGENPNGTWTLNASDVGATDIGNVTAFSLDITPFSCAAAPPPVSIAGQIITSGGGPLSGVTVKLSGTETGTDVTDASGDYSFALTTCGGAYTVTPSLAGHSFNPPQATFVSLPASQIANFAGTPFVPPSGLTPGKIVISEFRARGAAGALDEFIELYNKTDLTVTVGASDGSSAGWLVAALDSGGASSTPVYTIPNGTVIPPRGHYLIANAGGYTLDDSARADAYFTGDIPDNTGLAVFDSGTTSGAVLDAAGFNTAGAGFADTYREGGGMPPVGTTNGQYSLLRKLTSGTPLDTGNNTNDFVLVATDQGVYGARQSTLGSPGPENLSSPIVRNSTIKVSNIDIAQSASAAPNRVRTLAPYTDALTPVAAGGTFTDGTLTIRRRFTNQTGGPVSRLRFRIVDATVGTAPAGTADLRVLTSADSTVTLTGGGGSVTARGTTLEQPASQPQGGGLNSTVASGTITAFTPLAPGASIDVQFLLGVRQTGSFRFFVNVEALP